MKIDFIFQKLINEVLNQIEFDKIKLNNKIDNFILEVKTIFPSIIIFKDYKNDIYFKIIEDINFPNLNIVMNTYGCTTKEEFTNKLNEIKNTIKGGIK